MIRFLTLVGIAVVGLLFLAGMYIVVGSLVAFRINRARAAKLSCPQCKRAIGATAVTTAVRLQDDRNADFIRGLNLKEHQCVDISFHNLLPAVCPHCQTALEFDLDEIGIGPV